MSSVPHACIALHSESTSPHPRRRLSSNTHPRIPTETKSQIARQKFLIKKAMAARPKLTAEEAGGAGAEEGDDPALRPTKIFISHILEVRLRLRVLRTEASTAWQAAKPQSNTTH